MNLFVRRRATVADEVVEAAASLSKSKTGALVALERAELGDETAVALEQTAVGLERPGYGRSGESVEYCAVELDFQERLVLVLAVEIDQ